MGKEFQEYLDCSHVYACEVCKSHLTSQKYLISKAFSGRLGRAFLFEKIINFNLGNPQEKILLSGLYIIRDLYCKMCELIIGWKYEKAYEESQKYKEGKYIVERNQVVKIEWNLLNN